jgi:hypothetical protein
MANIIIKLTTPLTTDGFKSVCDLAPGQIPAIVNFENYVAALSGGLQSGSMVFNVGATKASATLTSYAAANPSETFTLLNIVFTAVDSSPGVNQFVLSSNVTTQATNIKNVINASGSLTGKVTATSLAGVVTITSLVAGSIGNGLMLTRDLTNTSITDFAGGSDGTEYTLNFI